MLDKSPAALGLDLSHDARWATREIHAYCGCASVKAEAALGCELPVKASKLLSDWSCRDVDAHLTKGGLVKPPPCSSHSSPSSPADGSVRRLLRGCRCACCCGRPGSCGNGGRASDDGLRAAR